MRRTTSSDPLWLKPGVGSTEVAAVVGCAVESDNLPLVCWARIRQKIELQEIKKLKKCQLEQGTPEWLTWRQAGMGGSEVACVVGANPYRDSKADRIWERKTGVREEVSDNSFMSHGRKYEPEARSLYESLYGWKVEPVCVLHDWHSFVRCSLDGLRPDDKLLLELKCPQRKNHLKYLEISKIEDHFERQSVFAQEFPAYRYQVLYQLLITEAEVAHFCSYSPEWDNAGDRLALIVVHPEPSEQRYLLERVCEFWALVESRTPPGKEWLSPAWHMPSDLKVPDA